MFSSDIYKLHFQSSRIVYVKIDVLNQKEKIVYQFETEAIDGSITVDAQNPSRRICDLQLIYKPQLIPGENSPIWLNKRIRVWLGIKSFINDEIYYFDWGIFIFSTVKIDITNTNKSININGLDKMALLDGTISGTLENETVINSETTLLDGTIYKTPIHEAVRSTAFTLGKETKLLIDTHEHTVPYKIEKQPGDTVFSILEELTNLYMNWQCYYDKNGFLNFNKRVNNLSSPIIWDFKENEIRINGSTDIDFTNIKNSYTIYGRLNDDGTQAMATYDITNVTEPSSPFTIEKIGENEKRKLVITEDKYYTNDACQQRLLYEKFKHTNFNEKINFSCIPIYFLDVNQVINYNLPNTDIYYKYVIDKITVGLRYDSPMSISAYKIY